MKRILCLLLAVLLLGLTACADAPAETTAPTEPTATEAPTTPPTEAPAPTEVIVPQTEQTIPVSDAMRFERRFAGDGTDWTLILAIPRIDLEYDTITRLNKLIYDGLEPVFMDCVNSLRNGGTPSLKGMDYTVSLKGNALSVVMTTTYPTGDTDVTSYCVDIHTGNQMTVAGIASAMGVAVDELNTAIANAAKKQFESLYANYSGDDAYELLLDETLDPDNLAKAQCYFDGEGKLMAAVPIYSFVGAKFYTHILPIEF